jgi:hypothetical protein
MQMYGVRLMQGDTMTNRRQGANRSPTHLLHQAEQAAGRLFAARAMGSTTPRQLAILVAVSENDGLNQTDVVQRTGIDRSTLTEIISRLLRKGLLQRRRSRVDTRAKVLPLIGAVSRGLTATQPRTTSAWRGFLLPTVWGREELLQRYGDRDSDH